MIGIYHRMDLDGIACGAIMKKAYPDITLIGYQYGEPLELPELGVPVIMADVSLPMKDMLRLSTSSNNQLLWVDHHAKRIDEYNNFMKGRKPFLTAVLEDGVAACELLHQHLFSHRTPLGIELLSMYDVHNVSDPIMYEHEVLPFQYGVRALCNSVETFPDWIITPATVDLLNVHEAIKIGKKVYSYQQKQNEAINKNLVFEADFCGLKALCRNGGEFNSHSFDSEFQSDRHDVMIPFEFNGLEYRVSIYSENKKIDCAELAKRNGGGGHAQAAGFQVKTFEDIGLKNIRRENI